MIDETAAFLIILASGVGGGFLSSWMAFNASGEVFSGRKHGNALITGALTGLALAIGTSLAGVADMSVPQFGIMVVTVFLGAVGIDRLRSSGADMAANNATESPTPKETET